MHDTSNHFFESSLQEGEILEAIRVSNLPLKFAYAGSASITHGRLSDSEGYKGVNWQITPEIEAARRSVTPETDTIIEFGPGDGQHTRSLLKEISKYCIVKEYIGADFSRMLFFNARQRVREALPVAEITFFPQDLESGPVVGLCVPYPAKSVFLVLGGLFANVEDPLAVAKHIRASLPAGVRGVISVPGIAASEPRLQLLPYQNDVFSDAALEPALSLGIPRRSIEFELSWDEVQFSVVGKIRFVQKWVCRQDESICFRAGDTIRCFISRRFQPQKLTNLLKAAGFDVLNERDLAADASLVALVRS